MSAKKIGGNTTNILNCYYQNKFTLWHTRLTIYIWKSKFSSSKQYLFGLLFSRNAKETHTDQSILQIFLLSLKKNISQTFKTAAPKKSFPNAYIIDTTFFDECFLFHVIIGRHYFLYIFIVTQRFDTTAMLLRSLKQLFWKKSAIYIRYLNNNITMLLIPTVQNIVSTS